MSEIMKHTPETPIQRGERELLAGRVDAKHKLAEAFGVTMRYQIRDLNDPMHPVIAESEPDAPVFAASINKLLVARAVVDGASEEDTGIESFLTDMLRDSDNEAASILIRYIGAADVNAIAAGAFERTGLHIRPNGTSHLGTTTPRDSLDMLLSLVDISDDAPRLARAAKQALGSSRSKYGVRPRLQQRGDVRLFNKSGQINQDGELKKQYGHDLYRHDVGVIMNGPRRIGYSILTEGSARTGPAKRLQAWIADTVIGQLGIRIAEATELETHAHTAAASGIARRAIFS